MNMTYPLTLPAIKVSQPLGVFYSVCLTSKQLKELTFSTRAKYAAKSVASSILGNMLGTQRDINEKREKEIARYIDSTESAFPNSIILGANVEENGSFNIKKTERWHVIKGKDGCNKLVIPSKKALAAIIDGQHRLGGFNFSEREEMELVCSVYLDLPAPFQAYLFATININQKNVSKSLAYELYGFRMSDEERNEWSPEKLAVYLARSLNFKDSPLKGRIILGAEIYEDQDDGVISLAAVVDGIIQLISSNPKKDRDDLLNFKNEHGRAGLEKKYRNLPLRKDYIEGSDDKIEGIIFEFVQVIHSALISDQIDGSYLRRTIGYIALFGVLRDYLNEKDGTFSVSDFTQRISNAKKVDFTSTFFNASGSGAGRIRNVLLCMAGLKEISELEKLKHYDEYAKILNE